MSGTQVLILFVIGVMFLSFCGSVALIATLVGTWMDQDAKGVWDPDHDDDGASR